MGGKGKREMGYGSRMKINVPNGGQNGKVVKTPCDKRCGSEHDLSIWDCIKLSTYA